MPSHTQKMFFARMLIALAALTALAQVTGAGGAFGPSGPDPGPHDAGRPLQTHQHSLPSAGKMQVKRALASSNPGSLNFRPEVRYDSGGGSPYSAEIADVNGDGNPDLLAVNFCLSPISCLNGSIGVLLGNGDGTFQPPVAYSSGSSHAGSLAVADVNGDGKPDLLVYTGSGVAVLLGNGDGTFQAAVTYALGGAIGCRLGSPSVAVADVNGDGKPDLLACTSDSVAVLLGNGDGTFQPGVTYRGGGDSVVSLAVADVNGDGRLDVVMLTNGSSSISVLLGNGDGTFQPPVSYSSDFVPTSVTVADVNGDGKPDLLMANSGSSRTSFESTVAVALGNGDGTFQSPVVYGSGGGAAHNVVVADMNGDGKPDLVVANSGNRSNTNNIAILLGNGDGTFQSAVSYSPLGGGPLSVTVADVNGDGKPDIFFPDSTGGGDGSVGVLLNNSGSIQHPTTTTLTSSLNPSLLGQAVTFKATVGSAAGIPPNGETIKFSNGSVVLGATSLSGGTASLTISSLPGGTSTIIASYAGDANFGPSVSAGLKQVVLPPTKYSTSTSLTSTLNPSLYGQRVTWVAVVTSSGPTAATGSVKFTWDRFAIGAATLDSNGMGTLTRSNLNADTYPLVAAYSGDAANLGSASTLLNQVVLETTSTATLTSSPNPSAVGQAVTFTAKVSSPTVIPTGPVTFTAGTTVLGTAQLSGGKATLTTSALPVGSTKVTVTYNGDSNIAKSSASVTQTVH